MQAHYPFLIALLFFYCPVQQAMDKESDRVAQENGANGDIVVSIEEKVRATQLIGEIILEVSHLQLASEALVNAEENLRALLQEFDDKPGWPKVLYLKQHILYGLQDASTLLRSSGLTDDNLIIKISSPSECIALFIVLQKMRPSIIHQGRQQEAISCCEHFAQTVKENPLLQAYAFLCVSFLVYLVASGARIPMM
jgi:hypothetical protein